MTSTARRFGGPIPGFGLSLGITLSVVGLLVLLPLAALVVKASGISAQALWENLSGPNARSAFALSFGAALAAAVVNAVFGLVVAWVLARYRFVGRSLLDALVDLPFALPTAVAGIALATLYSEEGWLGRHLVPLGIEVAYTRLGVAVALVFVGLPFVVRTVEPVLLELDPKVEEAAATLGAGRLRTFVSVVLPAVAPALLTGFALSFARGLGEYGSIVFISGNMPRQTQIVPFLIVSKLEQYDEVGATSIAVVMLAASFVVLFGINGLQAWLKRGRKRA